MRPKFGESITALKPLKMANLFRCGETWRAKTLSPNLLLGRVIVPLKTGFRHADTP
jgi:hypothetical protein